MDTLQMKRFAIEVGDDSSIAATSYATLPDLLQKYEQPNKVADGMAEQGLM